MQIGGVQVSSKHAGFIVNTGAGKASDFIKLVELVEKMAREKGYKFEREFVSLGF